MSQTLPAEKSREFHCDECNARCTRSESTDKEYGHAHHCSRRAALGMRQPPRYRGAVVTYTGGEYECPSCDETSSHYQAIQQHHVREHGRRLSMTECERCGVTVLLASCGYNVPQCLPCYAATDDHPERIDAEPRALATDGGESDEA